MNEIEQATNQLNNVIEQSLHNVFLPAFLKIIMPVIILIITFSIIRLKFRLSLPRRTYIMVNVFITIAFLVTFMNVTLPTIVETIKNITIEVPELPDGGSDPFEPPEELPDIN